MLLFHGTTMNRMAWDMVRAEMPAEYQFVMVEFPGSGESSMPDAELTVDVLIEQAIAVMDHLGHDRFHVAGYSLGAVAALATAAAAPERVITCTSLCGWATTDAADAIHVRPVAAIDRPRRPTVHALRRRRWLHSCRHRRSEPMLDDVIALGATALAPGSDAHLVLDEAVDIADRLERDHLTDVGDRRAAKIAGSTCRTATLSPRRSEARRCRSCRRGTW